jgi:hypothetical protein
MIIGKKYIIEMRINQTIRENMLNQLEHVIESDSELCKIVGVNYINFVCYLEGDESALNGEEIQTIFNKINE